MSFNPANNSVGVWGNTKLVVTYPENIFKGTGNIIIKKYSDDSTVETIAVGSDSVIVSGNMATIIASELTAGVRYYIEIQGTVFENEEEEAFDAISGNSTWNFTVNTSIKNRILKTLLISTTIGT